MTAVIARFRNPFPPHQVLSERRVGGLRYGFQIGRYARADFLISRDDENSPDTLRAGVMVTLERTDDYLPWVGFITRRRPSIRAPAIPFQARDHVGALFAKGRTPKDWEELDMASGLVIRQVLEEADVRGQPPLMVQLSSCKGGPTVAYTPKAETLTQFLRTMAKLGWEWSLKYEVTQGNVVTHFGWQERIGRDLSGQIVLQEGKHFEDATLTEDTLALINAGLAVGGGGVFRDRPGEEVNPEGTGSGGFQGTIGPTDAPVLRSPAQAGSRVVVEPAVSNRDALSSMARHLHDTEPSEALTFSLVESELDMSKIELGSTYLVRFSGLNLGLGVERKVRFKALSLGEDGIVGVEAEVLRATSA